MARPSRTAAVVAVIAAITAVALLAAGCGSAPAPRPAAPAAGRLLRGVVAAEPPVSPAAYGTADTRFGLDVLAALCRQRPDANVVLSPASLAAGLGMAYLGARGSTAEAMAAVLHLPATGPALEAGLQARAAALRRLDRPGVTVAAADQVWADPSLTPSASYLDAVATAYDGAGLRQVPLLGDPDLAARQIDAAIAAATAGHITGLLTPSSLQGVGWVLTDALYLKARWASPFNPAQTYPGPFTTAAGARAQARFLSGGPFASASAGGWTAVSLPYQGGQLAMTALLPDSGPSVCPGLTDAALNALTARLATGRVEVSIALPKVSLSSSTNMMGLLGRLGMSVAFGPAADFTGLSPKAGSIGLVLHAATLRVDEQGTVASAATAVGVLPSAIAVPRETIVFDRPYLLLVTDTATGEPLFLARVANPASS
jgi:serine protease inhibitor